MNKTFQQEAGLDNLVLSIRDTSRGIGNRLETLFDKWMKCKEEFTHKELSFNPLMFINFSLKNSKTQLRSNEMMMIEQSHFTTTNNDHKRPLKVIASQPSGRNPLGFPFQRVNGGEKLLISAFRIRVDRCPSARRRWWAPSGPSSIVSTCPKKVEQRKQRMASVKKKLKAVTLTEMITFLL